MVPVTVYLAHDLGAAVEHRTENLRRHDEARRVGVDGDVARHEADVGELLLQVAELLVRERLFPFPGFPVWFGCSAIVEDRTNGPHNESQFDGNGLGSSQLITNGLSSEAWSKHRRGARDGDRSCIAVRVCARVRVCDAPCSRTRPHAVGTRKT